MTILCRLMRALRFLFAALAAFAALDASAQTAPAPRVADFSGPRSMGMGDAHRAVASGNDGIYLNPAGLGQHKRYALEFVYLLNPAAPSNIINFSIVDSDTSPVATGLAYTHWSVGARGGRKSGSIFNLAFGYPLTDGVFFGWGLKYLNLDSQAAEDSISRVTTDFALMLRFSEMFSVGAVGYNLIKVNDDEAPRMLALAGAFGDDKEFRLAFDWTVDFDTRETTTAAFRAGGEVLVAQAFPVRAGYIKDNVREKSYATFGIGLVGEGLGLDFAYKRQVAGNEDSGQDHQFAAALRLQLK